MDRPRKSGYKIAEAAKVGLVKGDDESQDMEESRPIKKLLPHTATTLKATVSKVREYAIQPLLTIPKKT